MVFTFFVKRALPAVLSISLLSPWYLRAQDPNDKANPEPIEGFQWGPALKQSGIFLGIQHGFRFATEADTRAGLKGPFFQGWMDAASNLKGWSDGDPTYVNYVGHPMQGAVTGYIQVHNDPKYRKAEFGKNADYWRSRLRAMGFSALYSTQFEIGPISEASLGNIQAKPPQVGYVDHVVTPIVGLSWMVAEDALDSKVIERLERKIRSPYIKLLLRGGLNPSRSFANMLRGKVPWYRDNRGGVFEKHQP